MQNIKIYILILLLVLSNAIHIHAQTWNLVWSDEFSNQILNTTNWTVETGAGGWGNNELQYYTNRQDNVTIQNGNLLIIGKKETYLGSDYTSARIITKNKQSWKYGKIEARIKIPTKQGLWPAFWMLGQNIDQVSWPACGEIDIMEHVNTDDKIHGTMHWDANGHAYYGGDTIINDVTQFHVYSIEWDSVGIKWFVDGVNYWQASTYNNINSTSEFHNPFFIILNMAIGGNFPGSPTANSVTSDTLFIDYVKVYQKSSTPNSITNIDKNDKILLYPNPVHTSDKLHVNIPAIGDYTIDVLDLCGRVILRQHIKTHVIDHQVDVLVNNYKSGLYILTCNGVNYNSSKYFSVID